MIRWLRRWFDRVAFWREPGGLDYINRTKWRGRR